MREPFEVPQPPKFTADDLRRCRESGDYRPILFEWYKFVAGFCEFLASISQDSLAVREIEPLHYYALVGLLNRCSRLMLANVALSHEGRFGETTALIDRCIFESCVKATWLCHRNSADSFIRFIADGFKTDIEMKREIEANIAAREGQGTQKIERRMLLSFGQQIAFSGLTETQISNAKKLPDIAAMLEDLGYDRLWYIANQKMGSHHVHGTWASLRLYYLEENEEGILRPRGHDCPTHVEQYIVVASMVLDMGKAFINFIFDSQDAVVQMESFIEAIENKIKRLRREVFGDDFNLVDD